MSTVGYDRVNGIAPGKKHLQPSAPDQEQPGADTAAAASPGLPADPYAELLKSEFITVPELAAILRVSKMCVYRLVRGGAIPGAVQIGKLYRIPSSGAVAYLNGVACRPPKE